MQKIYGPAFQLISLPLLGWRMLSYRVATMVICSLPLGDHAAFGLSRAAPVKTLLYPISRCSLVFFHTFLPIPAPPVKLP